MKIMKIKLGLLSLLAALTFSVFLTSCEQENFSIEEDLIEEQVQTATDLDARYFNRFCFVKLCYSSYLSRCGEPGGINYWLSVLTGPEKIADVALGFINSQEAANIWENNYTSFLAANGLNRHQIRKDIYIAYRGLLRRQPDVGGGKHWTNVANSQGLKTAVIHIAGSNEFSNRLRNIQAECNAYNANCY